MKGRMIAVFVFVLAACGLFFLHDSWLLPVRLSPDRVGLDGLLHRGHTLWEFLGIACSILAFEQSAIIMIRLLLRSRGKPESEAKMLGGFVGVVAAIAIVGAFLYCLGVLGPTTAVVAGFAGLLLGWSLQAPVSGIAAWVLVTLKRPFRVSDRVLFPSIGLLGDVKQVGLMYTVLNQVGGAVGSEEAIGRDILIPNAMLFSQVAINYTPKAEAAYFLDEVVIRMTYDSDWDAAEEILLSAARAATGEVIKETGQEPYIRSDTWDYGILLRLRYMTMAKERPRITHEIVKHIFKAVQRDPRVDMAIPFVYSFRKSTDGIMRDQWPEPETVIQEVPVSAVEQDALPAPGGEGDIAETDPLVRNIQERGLLQPIVVTPVGADRYRILAGQRRFLACRRLGWKTIPVVIRRETHGIVAPA